MDGKNCANCFFAICYNAVKQLYLCDLRADSVSGSHCCGNWEDQNDWKKVSEHEDPEHENRKTV